MPVRSVEQWMEILEPMAADPMEEVANRILGDLVHYKDGQAYASDDLQQLGNAIVAWEKLGRGE